MSMTFPRVKVAVEQGDDIAEYVVQTDNRDAVRFDLLRARRNWPTGSDAPILFLTVVAYLALKRSGAQVPDDLDAALDLIVSVEPVDADGNPSREADAGVVTDPSL